MPVRAYRADISGMANGISSDAENDRQGRPREGQVSPAGPKPHFINLVGDLREYAPGQDRVMEAKAAWHPDNDNYIDTQAFEPYAVDLSNCIFGWLPASGGETWYPVLPCAVRKLCVKDAVVEAWVDEDTRVELANFGCDRKSIIKSLEEVPDDPAELQRLIDAAVGRSIRQARCFRAVVATYIAQALGYDFNPVVTPSE